MTLFGANTIAYEDGVGLTGEYIIKQSSQTECEHKNWYQYSSTTDYDIIQLIDSKTPSGNWELKDLPTLNIPGEIPSPEKPAKCLHILGEGRAYTFAALGVYVALAGKTELRFIKGSSPIQLIFTPKSASTFREFQENRNGIVIGILGDPNSGKSVFSSSFRECMRNILPNWCKTWIYDCDVAAQTQKWYLSGMQTDNENIRAHVSALRKLYKAKWTPAAEEQVAFTLKNLKCYQDIIVADMPGGKFPHNEEDFPPERIPHEGKRFEMMKACDAFIIIYRKDKQESFNAWKKALADYGLEKRIIAGFISDDYMAPFDMTDINQDDNGIFHAEMNGLNRDHKQDDIIRGMMLKMADFARYLSYFNVIAKAKAAVAKSFLTSDKGVRYGAAARSVVSGRIFSAGQYSSFNHSTNIHAEVGALLQATMAGEPDVDVLCISCTNTESAIPCGICRQVMLEHSKRTQRDFDVILTNQNGWPRVKRVSELLPIAWKAQEYEQQEFISKDIKIHPSLFLDSDCIAGAYCLDSRNPDKTILKLVWDSKFMPGEVLVKLKYEQQHDKWIKLPHALTEAAKYQKYLVNTQYNSLQFPSISMVHIASGVKFKKPAPLTIEYLEKDVLEALNSYIFIPAGIDINHDVFITNSRLLNLNRPDSDYDLMIMGNPEKIQILREVLSKCLLNETIKILSSSGSWKLIKDVFPSNSKDNIKRIISEYRYCDTFLFKNKGFSLLFTQANELQPYALENDALLRSRINVSGTVINAHLAPYKRSECILDADDGRQYRILCYHKLGTLLKEGDRIAICGNLIEDNVYTQKTEHGIEQKQEPRHTILLATYSTDKIVWLK